MIIPNQIIKCPYRHHQKYERTPCFRKYCIIKNKMIKRGNQVWCKGKAPCDLLYCMRYSQVQLTLSQNIKSQCNTVCGNRCYHENTATHSSKTEPSTIPTKCIIDIGYILFSWPDTWIWKAGKEVSYNYEHCPMINNLFYVIKHISQWTVEIRACIFGSKSMQVHKYCDIE